jgi:geranylgeranyl diphosphate synthase type I
VTLAAQISRLTPDPSPAVERAHVRAERRVLVPQKAQAARAFMHHLEQVRARLEPALHRLLDEAVEHARRAGGAGPAAVVTELRSVAMRGGKRMRPALAAAAFEAAGGADDDLVVQAGCALELFQAYVLIHDDWMDGSVVRRGEPSAHVSLARHFGDQALGNSMAILAGNLGSAMAHELVARLPVELAIQREIQNGFAEIHRELMYGQVLDLTGEYPDLASVERAGLLKTGCYTVRFPFFMGAMLAGASSDTRALLDAIATSLGLAYQLRDDWLDFFGVPEVLGKPVGRDLRNRRRTTMTMYLEEDPEGRELLSDVYRAHDRGTQALDQAIQSLLDWAHRDGFRQRMEEKIEALVREAHAAIQGRFPEPMRTVLHGAIEVLAHRSS